MVAATVTEKDNKQEDDGCSSSSSNKRPWKRTEKAFYRGILCEDKRQYYAKVKRVKCDIE